MESQRSIIDQAAEMLGKTRSDFMLEVACREAESVLLDHRFLFLPAEQYDQFLAALDAPVKDNPALKRLMARKTPWG